MKFYTAMITGLALATVSVVGVAQNATPQEQTAIWAVDPDKLEGMDILDSNGQQLGDADDVVVDKTNRRLVVIGLEDSTKEVVVTIDSLALSADGETLSTTLTRGELEALPDYDPSDMESVDD
jgi:hypothetical protein